MITGSVSQGPCCKQHRKFAVEKLVQNYWLLQVIVSGLTEDPAGTVAGAEETAANGNNPVGRRLHGIRAWDRRMLTVPGVLHLSGTGETVGDSTAGASVSAYGQAESNGVTDTHVEVRALQAGTVDLI